MSARSKLNSMESKTSEAFINNEISGEDFMTMINKERKYREFKESIRMMNTCFFYKHDVYKHIQAQVW